MATLPTLSEGIALTHCIVAEDVERAGRFYNDVLGGEIVLAGCRCGIWRRNQASMSEWLADGSGGFRPARPLISFGIACPLRRAAPAP
jgi:hypothetical protein